MTRSRDIADQQDNLGGAVAPVVAGKNAVINGGMDVCQRGTSFAGVQLYLAYCADRWGFYRGGSVGNATWTRQSSGLTGFQYSLRAQRNSGDTSTQYVGVWQAIETINSIPYAGKTVTVSFYAKAGANYSATSGNLLFNLVTGTGTDEPPYNFTGATVAIAQNASLTTSWQRFTFTGTLPTNTNEISLQFVGYPSGTAGANDWYELTGIQLEQGSAATPFSRAGGSIGGELALCQRYYYRVNETGATNRAITNGLYYTSTNVAGIVPLPVTMRVSPTIDQSTGTDYYGFVRNGAIDGFSSFTLDATGKNSVSVYNNTDVSGTVGQAGLIVTLNVNAFLGFTAEL